MPQVPEPLLINPVPGARHASILETFTAAFEPDSLEVVGTYSSSLEARLARCRLESAGIESFIFGDIPGARCGPIRLCVGQNDLADAHSLLAVTPPPKAVSDDLQDAVRVGLAIGGITGGFVGAIMGWAVTGIAAGAALGVGTNMKRWYSRHREVR
jgi:hypothetical protein